MAAFFQLLVGAQTVAVASRPTVSTSEMISYAKAALKKFHEIEREIPRIREDLEHKGNTESVFMKYFGGGDTSFSVFEKTSDNQFFETFRIMHNPQTFDAGFSLFNACVKCCVDSLTGFLHNVHPDMSPGTSLAQLKVSCKGDGIDPSVLSRLSHDLSTLLNGGKYSKPTPEMSDDLIDLRFSPPPMNSSAFPGGRSPVHIMECQTVGDKIECSGLGAGAKQPVYGGGVHVAEVYELVQPRVMGSAEYDEERREPNPEYLSPTDFMTLQRFTQAAILSSAEFLENPVGACLVKTRPTYTCTVLQEFATTSVILENSDNLVCEARESLSDREIASINAIMKGKAVKHHDTLGEPSGDLAVPSASHASSTRPATAAESAQHGVATPIKKSVFSKLKSMVPGLGRRRSSYDLVNAAKISQLEEAAANVNLSDYDTEDEYARPPPYNPSFPISDTSQREDETYVEPQTSKQDLNENISDDAMNAEARENFDAQGSAFPDVLKTRAKILASYYLHSGCVVLMSACQSLLRTLEALPVDRVQTISLDSIQVQLKSILDENFSIAESFLDLPMNIIRNAMDSRSPQTFQSALSKMSEITRLIEETTKVKAKLVAGGTDSLENVQEQVIHEAYRNLDLKLFQEIVARICEVVDKTTVEIVETAPTTPVRTGGNLAAEYILHLRENLCDVTSSDAQIFPSTPADQGLVGFPKHNLGERIMGWMEVAGSENPRKELFNIVDFTKTQEVVKFANEAWKAQIAALRAPSTPAPGFYAVTSSGCRNVNEDIKKRFFDVYIHNSAFMKLSHHGSEMSRQRFMQKVAMLHNDGSLSPLPIDMEYEYMELAQAMQNNFVAAPKGVLARRKAKHSPFGYLDLCDLACFRQVDKVHHDVLSTVFFSLDGTLMKISSKILRAYGIAKAFFHLGPNYVTGSDPNLAMWARRMFGFWESHQEVRKMQGLKTVKVNYKKLERGEFTLDTVHMRDALVRFVNMLKADSETRDLMNLVIHTWIQIRGVRNAAKGFKNSQKLKESLGESAVGAIFSKLWYERDVGNLSPHQYLKPFGAPLASVALQVGFFLHTVVEEYKMSIFEKAGAQIKSWFMGIFQKNKRLSIPRTWREVVAATRRQPKIDLKKYQGGLLVIKNLAKMFRERFLHRFHMQGQGSRIDYNTPTLLIHALVALWMDPTLNRFDLSNPRIHQAKKLFWYYVWVNENGPSNAAARIVLVGCKSYSRLDAGVVKSVSTATGDVVEAGSDILKMSSIRLNRSSIESYMNLLQASYSDPLEVLHVALDLAERCEGYTSTGDRRTLSFADSFTSGTGDARIFSAGEERGMRSFSEIQEEQAIANKDLKQDVNPQTFNQALPGAKAESFIHLVSTVKKLMKLKKQKSKSPKVQPGEAATSKPVKVKAGRTGSETSAAILGSKFMLDLWCLKYKSMIIDKLSGIKTTDVTVMHAEIDKVFNAVESIKIAVPKYKSMWDFSIRCDWMMNYPDEARMRASRTEMVSHALSKAGAGKKIRRAFQKAGSWIRKKALVFTKNLKKLKEKMKSAIGKASLVKTKVRDWATVNVGLGRWTGVVFTTHLTFKENEMACNGPHEPVRSISWNEGFTVLSTSSPKPDQRMVLCKVADGKHCWATREALFYKGWTGVPLRQSREPEGFWLEEVVSTAGESYVVNREGYLTTASSLTMQDIFPQAEPKVLNPQATMRIIGSDGNLIYEGHPTGVVQTPGGAMTLGSINQLVSGVQVAGDNIEVKVNVANSHLTGVGDLNPVYKDRTELIIR